MGAYKTVTHEETIDNCLEVSEIGELGGEMREWHDNMSGTPAERTGKYEIVGEAADVLETAADELDRVFDEIRSLIEKLVEGGGSDPLQTTVQISETVLKTKRRYGPSRDVRLRNSTGPIEAAVGALGKWVEHLEESETKDELDRLLEEILEHVGNLSEVEFPGMYG